MADTSDLQWRDDAVHLHGKGRALIKIVSDVTGLMYRVELPDGRLSDETNRTRAKEAASLIACRILNPKRDRRERGDVR
jgi:hypothetical protein